MTTIVTRITDPTGGTAKGTPLTSAEIDQNFINLNDNKLEITDLSSTNTVNKGVRRDSNGDIYVSTLNAVSIVESSSVAYKENINPISNALESVLSLTGVTYDRKDGSKINEAGMIAEDVFKVIPNIVVTNEQGQPDGINYTKVTAYLIEAIKELKAELDSLKESK